MKDKILKQLLESEFLNDESKAAVTEAFKSAIEEIRESEAATVRAELAEQYEKEKAAIRSALETFLEQHLTEHVKEFKEGFEELQEMKGVYAEKIASVKEQAQRYVAKRLGAVEHVIEGVLKKELSELHESEKTSRRAYLNAITEAKTSATSDREQFKKKAALVLEQLVDIKLGGMLEELREDITAAREADFGREIYESFVTSFRRQFFDSSKEFKKLALELKETKATAAKVTKVAKTRVAEAQTRATTAQAKAKKVTESYKRKHFIESALSRLSGKSRIKMEAILNAAKTANLKETYKRFLPDVMAESNKRPVRSSKSQSKLTETVVELTTGGKDVLTETTNSSKDDDEIIHIKNLAGIR